MCAYTVWIKTWLSTRLYWFNPKQNISLLSCRHSIEQTRMRSECASFFWWKDLDICKSEWRKSCLRIFKNWPRESWGERKLWTVWGKEGRNKLHRLRDMTAWHSTVLFLTALIFFWKLSLEMFLGFAAGNLMAAGEWDVSPHYFLIFLQEEIVLVVFTILEPVMFKQARVFFFSPK